MAYWYRRVFLLAVPLILSNLTQPLFSTVDTVLSGHLPGSAALGGVAMGGIFFNGVFWTFGFLRMATTGLVAQSFGARNEDGLRLHVLRALASAVVVGALILALQEPLILATLALLGAGGEVRQNALLYCHVRIWSAPAALANYVILGFLLGRQRARTALALQAVVNAVNVAVALFLVVRLHRGVAGIAAATVSADCAGCLIGLVLLWPILWHARRHASLRELLDVPSLKALFALNFDILLRTLSLVAAYGWFTRTGAKAGDATLAANAVLMNLHWIASYGLDGFANATEALVGEAVGAGRLDHFRAILGASTAAAGSVAAIISVVWLTTGRELIQVFTNQPEVAALATHYLPWAAALPVISVWGFLLDGVFIGATRGRDLRDAMVVSFFGFLVLAVVLERWMGNHGLWCAFCCFMLLRAFTLGLRVPRVEASFPGMKNAVPG
jgi:MATE family multidrug resistance protein